MTNLFARILLLCLLLSGLQHAVRAQGVGIGTNSPTQALDVNGSLRVRGLSNTLGNGLPVVRPDGTLGLGSPTYYATARDGQSTLLDSVSVGSRFPSCVAADGNTVYVGTRRVNLTPELKVYDARTPGAMTLTTTITLPDDPMRIAIAPGRLYVLGRLKLLTYTIGTTGTLTLASSYSLPVSQSNPLFLAPERMNTVGYFSTVEIGRSVAVRGTTVLLGLIDDTSFTGVVALDLSNASAPQLLSTLPVTGIINSVAVAGDAVYVALYNLNALRTYDYSNPTAPVLSHTAPLPNGAYQLVSNGSLLVALAANNATGLHWYNVATTPTQPTLLGTTSATLGSTRLALRGNTLYQALSYGGSESVRALNAVTRQEISRAAGPGFINDLAVGDDALFLVSGPTRQLLRYSLVSSGPARAVTVNADGSLGSVALPTLGLSGQTLSISGGNSVTLPNLGDNLGNHTATQNLRLPDYDLLLRPSNDLTSGLGHYGAGTATRNWAGLTINGPVLYGTGGGLLGSFDGSTRSAVLRWTSTGNVGVGTASPNTRLDVDGGLSLRPGASTTAITLDNQGVSVGNRSYLRLTSNATTAASRTIVLENGTQAGQLLLIENAGTTGSFEIVRSGTQALNAAAVTLTTADVLSLMWNGSSWIQMAFSDN